MLEGKEKVVFEYYRPAGAKEGCARCTFRSGQEDALPAAVITIHPVHLKNSRCNSDNRYIRYGDDLLC